MQRMKFVGLPNRKRMGLSQVKLMWILSGINGATKDYINGAIKGELDETTKDEINGATKDDIDRCANNGLDGLQKMKLMRLVE